VDYVDEKRIQSAFYHPVSKPKTRVGMTKIYPAVRKYALGVENLHSGLVDLNLDFVAVSFVLCFKIAFYDEKS